MVASGEQQLRTCVAHAKFGGGFFVVPASADLSPDQVESPCRAREQAPIPWKNERNPGRGS
jgi:hypothetical protein